MRHSPAQKALFMFLGLAAIAVLFFASPSMTAAAIADDETIAKAVMSGLSSDPLLGKRTIEVYSYQGRVNLVGFVDSEKEMDRATEVAKQTDGVRSVKNNLMYTDPHGPNIIPRDRGFQNP